MVPSAAIGPVIVVVAPLIFSLSVAVLTPIAAAAPRLWAFGTGVCAVVGVALFLVAKLSVLRKNELWSWGSGALAPHYRLAYRAGWGLLVAAVLMLVALAAVPF
jgi:hypothetical protein